MGRKQAGGRKHLFLLSAIVAITLLALGGCTHMKGLIFGGEELDEARQLMEGGQNKAALDKYQQILKDYPEIGDQALYPLGLYYTEPQNSGVDYQKALGYFQALLRDYPKSRFRPQTEALARLLAEVLNRGQRIRAAQQRIDVLEKKSDAIGRRSDTMERKAEAMEKKVGALELQIEQMKAIDKSVGAKKRRRTP